MIRGALVHRVARARNCSMRLTMWSIFSELIMHVIDYRQHTPDMLWLLCRRCRSCSRCTPPVDLATWIFQQDLRVDAMQVVQVDPINGEQAQAHLDTLACG